MQVYLVGMMGSGKTTVGRLLAKRLGCEFIDTDHEIERRTGVRVQAIFDIEGEKGFRDRETQLLKELAESASGVVATGGGCVLRPENRNVLKKSNCVVYLRVPARLAFERTRKDQSRPLLRVADPMQKLQELFCERDPLYQDVATIICESTGQNPNTVVRQIESELAKCVR
jgi:shikimate kinase